MAAKRPPGDHSLTPREQECYDLERQGIPQAQIARMLGISVDTVYKRLRKARQRLESQRIMRIHQERHTTNATKCTSPDLRPSLADPEICNTSVPERETAPI